MDDEDDLAIILCSSGTTGLPKRCCISHASLLYQAKNSPIMDSPNVALCFNTIHWITGILILTQGVLTHSERIITTEPYTPEYFFELVAKYKVTYYITTGFHINNQLKSPMISKADLSSVKTIHAGGTKVPYESLIRYQRFLPNARVLHVYGMTEIAGVATDPIYPSLNNSVGYLAAGIIAKIVDFNGNSQGPKERGEICMKISSKMLGYFNNPEANRKAFDNEGFYHSGDYGWFDDDGKLYVEDRMGDLIKSKYGLVGPSQIEEALVMQPAIEAVCVTAVGGPDSFDLPAAAVVRNAQSNITEQDIVEFMRETFPESKQLTGGIYFMDSLRATPSGKILRGEMREVLNKLYKSNI